MPLTDSRVKTIIEVLSSMKIIKMYGWELMFQELIEKVNICKYKMNGILLNLKRTLYNSCHVQG